MFFGKQNARIRCMQNMHRIILLPLVLGIIIAASACSATEGSDVIPGDQNETGFTMGFKEWSSEYKCELSLNKGDVLQIEVACEDGDIALTISGKNGSEPYTGNNLESFVFTVTVSETDIYDVCIAGNNATGKVSIKKVENCSSGKSII
ncbi:MAG: hypothetical protein GX272_00425 [Epulopiscium sp.]|jgi:hypothetical protein|nr:hypothetical protein [Candidatus Epulonipiscium sp.]